MGLINGDALSGALATLADEASATGDYTITKGSLTAERNITPSPVEVSFSGTNGAGAASNGASRDGGGACQAHGDKADVNCAGQSGS